MSMSNSKGKMGRRGMEEPIPGTAQVGEGLLRRPGKRLGRRLDDGGKDKDGKSPE